MAEPSYEELKAQLLEMQEQEAAKGGRPASSNGRRGAISFKVSPKGAASLYGLGRFPVTLYYEQWIRLLSQVEPLRAFLEANKGTLRMRNEEPSDG